MKKLFVLLSAVAFVVAFTVPAMSADWGFYGSARMGTFMNDVTPAGANPTSDDDLAWALQGNSRIGARVKAGAIGGRFEYGSTPNLRLLYGTWNFGSGTLLVGQSYTPVFALYSNQVGAGDNDLVKYGGIYSGRKPMIQLAMGGLKIALVTPTAVNIDPYTAASYSTATGAIVAVPASGTFTDTDTSMPKLEVSYKFKAGPVSLTPMFGYNSYDVVKANDASESVDSYILGIGATAGFGAAYVKASLYMGQNVANYGFLQDADGGAEWDDDTAKVVDNDSMGYQLIVGFKASDMITVEGGFGAVESEYDIAGPAYEDEASAYYINATINLAKGCFIVPEIGKFDHKDITKAGKSSEQGDTTYFGAKWQINF